MITETAAEKAARFLEEDAELRQRVHNLGPYAYTHIDWERRQERLKGVLEALRASTRSREAI